MPSARTRLMAALVLATVLGSLDASFVPLLFSDLIVDLDSSTSEVVWVALGYLIAATGPMLFLARIGDRRGHAALFRAGTLVYGLAMSGCAFAPGIVSLVALRCLQGLGMAAFLPATFALAVRAYPPGERGRAIGVLASANAFGFILGPLFAGFLLDAYDWRATFLTRTPLALLAVLMAFLFVKPAPGAPSAAAGPLDAKGALLLTLGLLGLLYGLNRLPVEDNHRDPVAWAIFAAGIAVTWLLVREEARHPDPLMDVSLFVKHPGFAKASFAFAILFATFPVYLFVLPIVLIAGLELTAWDAGLLLGSVALITFLVSPSAGKLSDRIGAERLCMVGAGFVAAGYLALLAIGVASGPRTILAPMVLIGIGTGLFFSPNNALILGGVPPARAGMASGLIGTLRQAGYALGFAVIASLFTFVQTRFETAWSRQGLLPLPGPMAERLSHVYEWGGLWSPEMLTFILHVAALVSAALTLLVVLYSAPRLALGLQGYLTTVGFVALIGLAAVLDVARRSELRLAGSAFVPAAAAAELPAVKAFGWAARAPVGQERLRGGPELYALYCQACHGADARGVANLGLNLRTSAFVRRASDAELLRLLRDGRARDARDSVTRRLMPGMRNFAGFAEENYAAVVEYLRGLNRGG